MAFYAVILLIYLLFAVVPFTPTLQRGLMARFHLRSPSFVSWALLQLLPTPYNFANQVWASSFPLSRAVVSGALPLPEGVHHQWVNHYPFRVVSFRERGYLASPISPYFFYARTRYRGSEVSTACRGTVENGALYLGCLNLPRR
jgi:hypothetical protein